MGKDKELIDINTDDYWRIADVWFKVGFLVGGLIVFGVMFSTIIFLFF